MNRPNILIIIVDQMNIDAISSYKSYFTDRAWGSHWVHTPNLDRLVGKGVSFMESHSPNPVCCPARSAIFTGRMTFETGVTFNNVGIDRNVPNMGEWFEQNSDYETIYCGKWHAGGAWNCPDVEGNRKIPGFKTMPVGTWGGGDILDYQVSAASEAFIYNYSGERPFLLVSSLLNPHDICYWSNGLWGDMATAKGDIFNIGENWPDLPPNHTYDFKEPMGMVHGKGRKESFDESKWRNYMYDYYRMIEKLDGDVGRMLSAVESRDDETLIIFTSDHGEGLGRHGRFQKWHPYDQSVKVPLIVSLPGRITEGRIDTEHLVSGVDIMSTICDYANIPAPPHSRGRSMKSLLEEEAGDRTDWRDEVYAEIRMTGRMIRTSRYKYVTFYEYSGDKERPFVRKSDGSPSQFEPGCGELYVQNPVKLLFNMKDDPWELTNLFDDLSYGQIMSEHEERLKRWEEVLIPGIHFDRN